MIFIVFCFINMIDVTTKVNNIIKIFIYFFNDFFEEIFPFKYLTFVNFLKFLGLFNDNEVTFQPNCKHFFAK